MKTLFIYLLLFVFLFSCNEKEKPAAVVMKTLNYPSASAVEYVDGKLYVMGDDATQMLVLDTNFNVVDSIKLFDYPEKRIPKNIKHDIESMLYINSSENLFLLGSGSLAPYRDTMWSVNLKTKKFEKMPLDLLFSKLKSQNTKQINIEGAVWTKYGYVLANRGNLSMLTNHLVFTSSLFPGEKDKFEISDLRVIDSSFFTGISGLTHSELNDALVMTASTEQTTNSYEDGAIGKSYICIMKNISYHINRIPDLVIDLEEINAIFRGQKIESVTILEESKESLRLVLVADNDNGSSSIFKLSIKLN